MKKITNKEDTTVYGHGEQKKFFLCIWYLWIVPPDNMPNEIQVKMDII
jgi:hypothetical protein